MKIALDIDDVVAGFHKHVCHYYGVPFQKRNYWDETVMDETFGKEWFTKELAHRHDFWYTMPVNIRPEEIDFKFHYYLSSFPEEMHEVRTAWLRHHGFPIRPLICSHNKLEVCKALDIDILVDDKPATAQAFLESGKTCLHYINDYADFDPIGPFIQNISEVEYFL